jgi:hypothetical protein
MTLLSTDDPFVQGFVTATILDIANSRHVPRDVMFLYTDSIRDLHQRTGSDRTRANCLGLLAYWATNFGDIEALVIEAIESGSVAELINAAMAVQLYTPASISIYRALLTRMETQDYYPGLGGKVASAMVAIAKAMSASTETYYADRLEDGAEFLEEYPGEPFERQVMLIRLAATNIRQNYDAVNGRRAGTAEALDLYRYVLHESVSLALFADSVTRINGTEVTELAVDADRRELQYLGNSGPFADGLNIFERVSVRTRIALWLEDGLIRQFENPYRSSYAIVAAIDEYESLVPGYENLGKMVNNANVLRDVLIRKGFPEENIFFLSDEETRATRIEALLKEFWKGGKYEGADRLLFYFGGHGDYTTISSQPNESNGVLITADFDPMRPTLTGLLMEDLTFRHFRNIVSNHVVVLLDACSSGLALQQFQQGTESESALRRKFRKYVTLKAELDRPARNILVAGTGEQRALYKEGGIFTTALVESLSGAGDVNKDGIVDFDELALTVTHAVRTRAADHGVAQEPDAFKATLYGKGSVVFFDQ